MTRWYHTINQFKRLASFAKNVEWLGEPSKDRKIPIPEQPSHNGDCNLWAAICTEAELPRLLSRLIYGEMDYASIWAADSGMDFPFGLHSNDTSDSERDIPKDIQRAKGCNHITHHIVVPFIVKGYKGIECRSCRCATTFLRLARISWNIFGRGRHSLCCYTVWDFPRNTDISFWKQE